MNAGPAFLVGAGFSAAFGVPTMAPFLDDFVAYENRFHPALAAPLRQVLARAGSHPDIEFLLSSLSAAAELATGLPPGYGDPRLSEWVANAVAVRSHLLSYIVERCEQFDRDAAMELIPHFLRAIVRCSGVVFTTNYDRILEYTAAEAGLETSDGFDQTIGEAANPWTGLFDAGLSIAKLHGSVTWYTDPSESVYLRLDRGYPLPGSDFHLARGTALLEPLMVVPTLEKATLKAPYNLLSTYFADVLSSATVLVVIGSSLRDGHIAGAINYHGGRLPVLIVGNHADALVGRLEVAGAVPLALSSQHFLRHSVEHLSETLTECAASADFDARLRVLVDFAVQQASRAAGRETLSEAEDGSIVALSRASELGQVAALTDLRSSTHPAVAPAVMTALKSKSALVRTAAAGCLGLLRWRDGVPKLLDQAVSDPDPGARLEAALALQRIGGEAAAEALRTRAATRREDEFITAALSEAA